MQKVKVTKRERKALGRNFAYHYSVSKGTVHDIGGVDYIGSTPVLQEFKNPLTGISMGFVKIQKGVPFVRVG